MSQSMFYMYITLKMGEGDVTLMIHKRLGQGWNSRYSLYLGTEEEFYVSSEFSEPMTRSIIGWLSGITGLALFDSYQDQAVTVTIDRFQTETSIKVTENISSSPDSDGEKQQL